jgi:hypothetical protein
MTNGAVTILRGDRQFNRDRDEFSRNRVQIPASGPGKNRRERVSATGWGVLLRVGQGYFLPAAIGSSTGDETKKRRGAKTPALTLEGRDNDHEVVGVRCFCCSQVFCVQYRNTRARMHWYMYSIFDILFQNLSDPDTSITFLRHPAKTCCFPPENTCTIRQKGGRGTQGHAGCGRGVPAGGRAPCHLRERYLNNQ